MIRRSTFKPARWLSSPHVQTILPNIFSRPTRIATIRERVVLDDGDFIDLDWTPPSDGPLVLVLHGLGGSSKSNYVKGMLSQIVSQGWQAVVMHFRGCSGEPNLLPQGYHAGDTKDMDMVVKLITQRYPNRKLLAIGYSLGGNVLLKWMGEVGDRSPIELACAVSVPFDVARTIQTMNKGMSRFYQWWFMRGLKRSMLSKVQIVDMPLKQDGVKKISTIQEFDRLITVPVHGLSNLDDFYSRAGCLPYLKNIKTKTLLLHAEDDPLLDTMNILKGAELSPQLEIELSEYGGHVGFIEGGYPWDLHYFLERRIPAFFLEHLVRDTI